MKQREGRHQKEGSFDKLNQRQQCSTLRKESLFYLNRDINLNITRENQYLFLPRILYWQGFPFLESTA